MTTYLPFKPATLAVCIVAALHCTPLLAAEPTIRASGGVSLGLRNDGVLFQWGGQAFTPVPLEGTLATPLHPEAVILSQVASLPRRELQDEFGNANTLTTQPLIYNPGIQTRNLGRAVQDNALLTWAPTGSNINKAQPTQGVPGFQRLVQEGKYEFALDLSGQVLSFIEKGIILIPGETLLQLPGLSEVQKVLGIEESFYLGLTQGGNVFQGAWDFWNGQQFTTATPVEGLSGVTDIAFYRDKFIALTVNGDVYMWKGNPPTPVLVSGVFDAIKILPGASNLALTKRGEVYRWSWDSNRPTLTTWVINGISSIAGSPYNGSYFALSNTGQLYQLREGTAALINGPSHVKAINAYEHTGYYTLLTDAGEVYLWNGNSISQIRGLSQVEQIQGTSTLPIQFLALTTDKKVYHWDSDTTLATQVSDWNDATAMAIGEGWYRNSEQPHFLVLREDGNLCGWGNNASGQLGANNPPSIDTPVCGIEDLKVATGEIYPLKIVKTGNGMVTASIGKINCGTVCTDSYLVGNKVTLTANAEVNFQLSEWTGGCSGTEPETQVTIQGATDCTATFEPIPPSTLTMQKSGLGRGTVTASVNGTATSLNCGNACTESYPTGSLVILKATPGADSKFVKWSGAGCNDSIKLTEDKTCTATFALLSVPTLTVNNNSGGGRVVSIPAGIDCGPTCSAQFLEGTSVKLQATSEAGFSFGGWWGDWWQTGGCYGNNPLSVPLDKDVTCNVNFISGGGTPNINVGQTSFNFEAPSSTSKVTQTISINNTSTWESPTAALQVGRTTVDNPAFVVKDTCSNTEIAPWYSCNLEVEFHPQSANSNTATLSIPSNDPDTPTTTVSLNGSVCSYSLQPSISIYPNPLSFGTQSIGDSTSLSSSIYINAWGQSCGMPQIDTIQFTGLHASEFSFKDKQCYHGGYSGYSYSSCSFSVVFSPTSEGQKEAELNIMFNDPTLEPSSILIQAEATTERAHIEISPLNIDFGTVSLERSKSEPVTIKNTGKVNLKLKDISVSGSPSFSIPDLWNCYSYYGGSNVPELPPAGQCQINPQFAPVEVGDKQGKLTVTSNDPDSHVTPITLKGQAVEPLDCSDNNITIESAKSGAWGSGSTWNQGTPPTETDVVRIKGGHTITGIAYAKVKTLCIEAQAILESPDDKGSPLWIQVSDYIQNQGTVRGKDGANESNSAGCTSKEMLGQGNCAYPGASVSLVTGTVTPTTYNWGGEQQWNEWQGSGSPISNEGTIIAGKGGNGSHYAAAGGAITALGRKTTNALSGVIKAGGGGHLLGTSQGEAGRGGNAEIWGRLGGEDYLRNYGEMRGGDGGDCNPSAREPQVGGNGGGLNLASHLADLKGLHAAGKGGNHCQPLGTNGQDGQVMIDPSIISLAGAHTQVEGGNVTIFGGNGWVLNLSNLDHPVIQASGDITLAVGEGGLIDLRGSKQIILGAKGQVTLFSNSILLDEGKKLSDVIAAKNIVVAPSKILREVSLTASERVIGSPATTVPVILVLNNSGPEPDTYGLKVTEAKGWSFGQLPETVTVAGLSAVEMAFQVTLPSTRGEMNRLQVTATSQMDPMVSATKEIQIGVSRKDSEVMVPIMPSAAGSHPSTGGVTGSSGIPSSSAVVAAEGCPSTGVITSLCNNRNRTIRNATLGASAKVSGGALAGKIDNHGFVSQVTIQPDTELNGGTLSGYITNQGTLRDFTFVGASIKGGTLAGTIRNASRVGGKLIDVTLAPHAHVIGGKLAGTIVGDKNAPALLENVRILAGSYLSGVTLGAGVILEQGVIIIEGDEEANHQFADLGETTATDKQGQPVVTTSIFKGGIALNQQASFQAEQEAVALSDTVEILGHIAVDSSQVGQEAEMVVYMTYQASLKEAPVNLMVDSEMNILPWDGVPHSLVAFKKQVLLSEVTEVPIYQGVLLFPGIVKIHFGYRLPEGLVVSHSQAIILRVVE